jgi:hypothetical protein
MVKINEYNLIRKNPNKETFNDFIINVNDIILSRKNFKFIGGVYLFPDNWYYLIPNGFKVTYLTYKTSKFEFGFTSRVSFDGYLGYGVTYNHNHIQSDQNTN